MWNAAEVDSRQRYLFSYKFFLSVKYARQQATGADWRPFLVGERTHLLVCSLFCVWVPVAITACLYLCLNPLDPLVSTGAHWENFGLCFLHRKQILIYCCITLHFSIRWRKSSVISEVNPPAMAIEICASLALKTARPMFSHLHKVRMCQVLIKHCAIWMYMGVWGPGSDILCFFPLFSVERFFLMPPFSLLSCFGMSHLICIVCCFV